MTEPLSNRLTAIAEDVADFEAKDRRRTEERRADFLATGALLVEARGLCQHGQWGAFLGRAGITQQRASDMMRLASAGIEITDIGDLGGLRKTLALPDATLRRIVVQRRETAAKQAEIAGLKADRDRLLAKRREAYSKTPEGRAWLAEIEQGEAEIERVKAETAKIVQATEKVRAETLATTKDTARQLEKTAELTELLVEKQTIVDTLRENIQLRARVAELEAKDNDG